MPTRTAIFGRDVNEIREECGKYPEFCVVDEDPDVVVCYGGDGTLLTAERQWPNIPKVPIRNSQRGNRCIGHPAPLVIERLAHGELIRTEYMKLFCSVSFSDPDKNTLAMQAMNEINVHMARINSAVRFRLWLDHESYGSEPDIIGDGFLVSTPFGSTAYFNHITRGIFQTGLGIAFKATSEHTNHVVAPEDTVIRILITRGPALLGFDNSPTYTDLHEGDELTIRKHDAPAILLTCESVKYPSDAF